MMLKPEIWDTNIPEPILNPKCVSCRCYWKPDNDDIKSSGSLYKSCRRCRKPKMTSDEIVEKQRLYAREYRMKKKNIQNSKI